MLKHGGDTGAMKSRNREVRWEISEAHSAGELSVDRKIM
jgi:hypothetical protein